VVQSRTLIVIAALSITAVVAGVLLRRDVIRRGALPRSSNHTDLAGEWVSDTRIMNGDSVQLVVDIEWTGSRMAGEFDVLAWGLENYPVDVTTSDSTILFHFGGPNADFSGRRSGEVLEGRVTFESDTSPVTLRRMGDARLSETFRELERAADDSTLVQRLSSDGSELRRQFNADRGKKRLLMLLAPS
jgi:hypothetical protein